MNRSYRIHLASLALTKTADGLIDPKLVLAWLLDAIGSPGFLVGMLVPVRESGALLPQLLLARVIQKSKIRKYFWAGGAAVQGLAAFGIAIAAIALPGRVAGWVILVLLAMLAVARSACSASYKDVLSRTIKKRMRGKVSGSAGTIAAIAVLAFAVLLSTGLLPREPVAISGAIAFAGCLWLLAAAVFARLDEPADQSASDADVSLSGLLDPLQRDGEFRNFIATRALLISTALAPPFLVMLGSGDTGFGNLGLLVLASSVASILSAYIWGALSDWSSRKTLMLAGAVSGVMLAIAATTGFLDVNDRSGVLIAGYVFVSQIAYQGVRAGRKTHLTDMDSDGRKSVYTALSNTLIGVLLVLGGLFGALADAAGPESVLAILAAFSLTAILAASRLSEVQRETP
ncbi:MAG: MFS transporter [Sedimentitalea sp.]|uniref:MFS transporter n=1 Tax=Sedimentitalea sp. TaxID=2048915 RepID=UPI003265E4EF